MIPVIKHIGDKRIQYLSLSNSRLAVRFLFHMTETRTGKKTNAVMAKHMYIFILKSIIIASSVFPYTIE